MKGINAFPFSPFFQELARHGINVTLADYSRLCKVLRTDGDWNVKKLRIVMEALLVKDPQETTRFRRCYDSFFTAQPVENLVRPLAQPTRTESHGTDLTRPVESKSKNLFQDYMILVLAVIAAIAIAYGIDQSRSNTTPVSPTPNINAKPGPGPASPTPTPTPTPPPIPFFSDFQRMLRALVIVLFVTGIVYGLFRMFQAIRSRRPQPTHGATAHRSEDNGPRVFSLRAIGGEQLTLLSPEALDQIASSVHYAMNELPSKRLDLNRSVAASVRLGGLLSLVYQRSKTIRTVNVIVDGYAQSLKWNSVPQELATGLSRRGLRVEFGKFFGKPDRFIMENGSIISLQDLEDVRNRSLLLIFSDGKRLDYERDKPTLELLRQRRAAAWFDLRESKFWDESSWLIRHFGVPLFEASESGLLEAMDYFLTNDDQERNDRRAVNRSWRGAPAFVAGDVDAGLEQLLEDALPWAQCCSMLQPLPLEFANGLRKKFQPHLPAERIERLFRIPGTWFDDSCLTFSRPMLASLRSGFSVQWDEPDQLAMLRFILKSIETAEPSEVGSIKHLAWKWALERVRLELEPDEALVRINRLSRTALGPYIRSEMAHIRRASENLAHTDDNTIPLRVEPETKRANTIMSQFRRAETVEQSEKLRYRVPLRGRQASLVLSELLPVRMAVAFGRGMIEFTTSCFEFVAYFPYPPGHRRTLAPEDPPGFRYFNKWFN